MKIPISISAAVFCALLAALLLIGCQTTGNSGEKVNVPTRTLKSVVIKPNPCYVELGKVGHIYAYGFDDIKMDMSIKPNWSIIGSNQAKVSINTNFGTSIMVIASKEGRSTIEARLNGIRGEAEIIAYKIRKIEITPAQSIVSNGMSMQLVIRGMGADGYEKPILSDTRWSIVVNGGALGKLSTNTGNSVTFTASAPGTVQIAANASDCKATATVKIPK